MSFRRVQPINNNGSIRIRFTFGGRRFGLSTGGKYGDRFDMAFAGAVAARIELDIRSGNFDETLERYKSGSTPQPAPQAEVEVLATTLLDLWDEWVGSLDLSDETRAGHYHLCRQTILRADPVAAVDDASWLADASAKQSPGVYNERLGYFRRCLGWAVLEGKAATNPYLKLKRRKVKRDRVKPFSTEEMRRILQGFNDLCPNYTPYVTFLLLTGCRPAEAVGIQWKRVDFGRGEVAIIDSMPKSKVTGKLTRKSTKTGTTTIFNMNDALRHLLQSIPRGKPEDLVFKFDGAPIERPKFNRAWKKVLDSQAVVYRKPYTTRHSFASHAVDQGLTLIEVAHLLGHADTRMVAETYGHTINRPNLPELNL